MPVRFLTQALLQRYLLQFPPSQRLVRFNALIDVRWLKPSLEAIKPEVLPDAEDVPTSSSRLDVIQEPTSHYHQYRCTVGNPLSCSQADAGISRCEQCYFPARLSVETRLTGKQGQYQITASLGRRGIGRLYAATRLGAEQPVVVQEYLLPERYFSPAEQKQYQDAFTGLAGLALADGRTQDMRIVAPLEAINDPSGERSYLVSPAVDGVPTLNQACAQRGPFSSDAVMGVLNQVLQTLAFLHQQKFALPTGQVQTGIVHGNLSLDSLLWVDDDKGDKDLIPGYVYLTDFALWEKLFDPALADRGQFQPDQDLAALGQVAFFLLNGATIDDQGQGLNPRLSSDWPDDVDPPLQFFIQQLLGIESPFASAEAARRALLALPPRSVVSQVEQRAAKVEPVKRPWYRRYLPILVTAVLLATLGSVAWLVLRSRRPSFAETLLPPCCLDAVDAVPTGDYTYAIPRSAYWYAPFRAVDPADLTDPSLAESWFGQLAAVHPELLFNVAVERDVASAIAAVQSGEADFTLVPLTAPLPPDITATIIAYDSLVPVVAFSYPDRKKGLPDELNGRLTMAQLAQIYEGTLDSWDALQATALPIRRYWVADPTAQQILIDQVLLPETAGFEGGSSAAGLSEAQPSAEIAFSGLAQPQALPALPMLRQILQDFENETVGSIGISPLSQAMGQCSVYPLALTKAGNTVSPLVFDTGAAVTPNSDLCDRKGSYFPNATALRNGDYPLAYPLAVVYPFDNTRSDIGKTVARLLLTQDSQQYLSSLGLVTAYPLSENEGSR